MEKANERPYITVVLTKLKTLWGTYRCVQIDPNCESFKFKYFNNSTSFIGKNLFSNRNRLRSSRIIKSLIIENEMYKTWAVLIGLTVTNISWWTALYGRRWPPLISPQASVVDRAWRSSRAKQTISFTIICGSKAVLLLCSKHSAKPRRHNTVAKKNTFKITPSS